MQVNAPELAPDDKQRLFDCKVSLEDAVKKVLRNSGETGNMPQSATKLKIMLALNGYSGEYDRTDMFMALVRIVFNSVSRKNATDPIPTYAWLAKQAIQTVFIDELAVNFETITEMVPDWWSSNALILHEWREIVKRKTKIPDVDDSVLCEMAQIHYNASSHE